MRSSGFTSAARVASPSRPTPVLAALLAAAAGLLVGAALLPRAALAGDDAEHAYATSAAERDIARLLSVEQESGPFVFHFRPGGQAAGEARADLEARIGAALAKASARLDWRPEKKLHVFIYESAREMADLTGRPSREAACFAEALHVAIDKEGKIPVGAAVARLLEPAWGRAGEKPGAGLEGGRWCKLRVAARGDRIDVSVDEKRLPSAEIKEGAAGYIGLGVEDGRLGIRALKVRPLPAEGDAPADAPWTHPLRSPGDKAWAQDVPGRFHVADEEIEGIRYGRMTRARFTGEKWKDFELECEMRVSDGALAEVAVHAQGGAGGNGERVVFAPSRIALYVPDAKSGRDIGKPLTGPFVTLREGFAVAIGGEIDGAPVHSLARAIADRNLAPPASLVLGGLPAAAGDRQRRLYLLGSFVAWAIETKGAAKYRDLHFAPIGADGQTPLGELSKLEADWRAWLKERKVPREERDAAERRLGLDVMSDVSAWRDLGDQIAAKKLKLAKGGAGTLETSGAGLDWKGPGMGAGTAKVELGQTLPQTVGVRLEVKLGEGARVRLVVKDREGRATTVVLSTSGAQILSPENAIAARSEFGLEEGRSYEVALVLDGEAGRLYVDGQLAAEAKAGLSSGPGTASLELEGRRVEVPKIHVRLSE